MCYLNYHHGRPLSGSDDDGDDDDDDDGVNTPNR